MRITTLALVVLLTGCTAEATRNLIAVQQVGDEVLTCGAVEDTRLAVDVDASEVGDVFQQMRVQTMSDGGPPPCECSPDRSMCVCMRGGVCDVQIRE